MVLTLLRSTSPHHYPMSADLGSKDNRTTTMIASGKNIWEGLQTKREHSNHVSASAGLPCPSPLGLKKQSRNGWAQEPSKGTDSDSGAGLLTFSPDCQRGHRGYDMLRDFLEFCGS